MPKYMEVAAEANTLAKKLMEKIKGPLGETEYSEVAEMVARLVNYGIRCNPRPAMSTVRLNAVKRAVEGLPVKVWMEERTDEKTGRSFKVLCTVPQGGKITVEATKDEE